MRHTGTPSRFVMRLPPLLVFCACLFVATQAPCAPLASAYKRFIAAENAFSLACDATGAAWTWGWNNSGQIGNNVTGVDQPIPYRLPGLSGVVAVAAGYSASMAVTASGSVLGWGLNASGQLGTGETGNHPSPVPTGFSGIKAVSMYTHTLALAKDGTVWVSGANGNGQLGLGNTDSRSIPIQIPGLSGVQAVEAGTGFSLALKSDGTVWAWGYNFAGQLGQGDTGDRWSPNQILGLSGVVAISTIGSHCLALDNQGGVWAWGLNDSGQLGTGDTAPRYWPIKVIGLPPMQAVAAGVYHSMALAVGGVPWAWGGNSGGQLGTGDYGDHYVPVQSPPGKSGYVTLTTGYAHSMAVDGTGGVWAWGVNGHGCFGNGGTASSPVPVRSLMTLRLPAPGSAAAAMLLLGN